MRSAQPAGSRRRLGPRAVLLVGGLLLLRVAAPGLFVVAVAADANGAVLAAVGCVLCGVVVVRQALLPQRASFRAGTKIWQNDGLPGGGAGGI